MSLSTTANKVIHNGNSSATNFPFTFPIPDASYLSVIYTDADDVETTLSPSEYSVSGIGSLTGGGVTYPLSGSPIATGTKLTIVRTVPYTQNTILSNQGGYYPEVVEARFDLVYMAMQQLAEIVGRYTVSSISDPATEQSNYALIQTLQQMDLLTTQGDILTRDASAYKRLARGSSGQLLSVSGSDLAWRDAILPKMHIYGLTWANGTDATNDLNIAAGGCMDDTGTDWIQIAATTKQSDVVWGADNGATPTGGLDLIGSAGNNNFEVYAIKNPTSGVTGVLFVREGDSPTMPSGYTLKRKINWFKRSGGSIVAAKQYETEGGGIELAWTTPTRDINLNNTLTNTRRTDALKVPLAFATDAHVRMVVADASADFHAIVCSPDEGDVAPNTTGADTPLYNIVNSFSSSIFGYLQAWIRTDATGKIAARVGEAVTVDSYVCVTLGFRWARR